MKTPTTLEEVFAILEKCEYQPFSHPFTALEVADITILSVSDRRKVLAVVPRTDTARNSLGDGPPAFYRAGRVISPPLEYSVAVACLSIIQRDYGKTKI